MKLLLDTHYALWLTLGGAALTAGERRLLADNAEHLFLSSVSIWELRLKWHRFHPSGARKGLLDPSVVLAAMTGIGITIVPMTAAHAAATLTVPVGHGDPFDEMLLVQAQVEGLQLLTRDQALRGHPLALHQAET